MKNYIIGYGGHMKPNNTIRRHPRSMAEAFKDERAHSMWAPNGKPIPTSPGLLRRVWDFLWGRK